MALNYSNKNVTNERKTRKNKRRYRNNPEASIRGFGPLYGTEAKDR